MQPMYQGNAALSLEPWWEKPAANDELASDREHYNYFRYYDPNTGRYITADPIGQLGGVNLYAYVENTPVNRTDPLGLSSLIFVRPTPIIVRPTPTTRPITQQRPGESIGQMGRRLEQTIRDRQQQGIPETRQPIPNPPAGGADPIGGGVRLIDRIGDFFRDLRGLDDLFDLPPITPDNPFGLDEKDLMC